MESASSGAPSALIAGDGDGASELSEALALEGFAVTRVHDGWAALDHLRTRSADVALLYQALPGLEGVDLCRLIKRDRETARVPVLLLSDPPARSRDRLSIDDTDPDESIALPLDLRLVLARTRTLVRLKRRDDDGALSASAMMTLATMLEAKSRYADGHCQRTANYAAMLGRRIGLGDDELETLRRGAFLHDVGMLAVPDTVLLKSAPLDPDEVALIRSHPVIGESLVTTLPSLQPSGVIVRQHHERRDGSGYPDGLQGDDISLFAQIVAIVDTFEALTSSRPYQDTVSPRDALDLLREQARLGLHRRDLLDEFTDIIHAR